MLTKQEENELMRNSIERVMNKSVDLLRRVPTFNDQQDEDAAEVNIEDWEVLKPIIVKLWNEKRDEIFRRRNNMPPADA